MSFESTHGLQAAFVTGGAQRIGKAIALVLAERGFDIALHYNRSRKDAIILAEQIRRKNVRCEIFACDLRKESQVSLLLEKVYRRFPILSVLVNNAAIFDRSGFGRAGVKSLDEHWAVNFKAPFILSGEFARLCRKGQVINILDTKVQKNRTEYVGYMIAKKALTELTKMSALAWAPDIRVNGISPGIILPPPDKGKEYLRKRAAQIPLKRQGDVRFITQTVEFLLDNPFVTGQNICVDGGEFLL